MILNIYLKYENISLWFFNKVSFSNENIYITQEKEIIGIKREDFFFFRYLRIIPVLQILFLLLFASFEIRKLFLFLSVQKLACGKNNYSLSTAVVHWSDWDWRHWWTPWTVMSGQGCAAVIGSGGEEGREWVGGSSKISILSGRLDIVVANTLSINAVRAGKTWNPYHSNSYQIFFIKIY